MKSRGDDAASGGSIRRADDVSFRIFVESVRDYALLLLDPGGRIMSWNSGAQAIQGYRAEEIIGRHFSVFYPPEALAARLPERELTEAARDGRFEDEGWRVRKDGSRYWANVIITAVHGADGELMGYAKVTRDLSERRAHERQLELSEERFRLLVESVIDYAIITVDERGFVTSWNSGAERINGYAAREIVGQHFSRLYVPEDVSTAKPARELALASEQGRFTDEAWRVRKDGTQYWANTVIAPLRVSEGHPRAFYIVTQDLTQRRHAETLADTAQRMHEFIAMLAHELRNPLAPIRNAVALMARRGLEDPLTEAMRQTIDRQTTQLTRILDALLDVNRIARGQFTIDKQAIDLRDVLARAVETCRPIIEARSHRLHISVADYPIDCFGDPLRLTQVVVNLLNNAAKYTSDGGDIWLAARADGAQAQICVRDSGRGIERDALDRVFDLFMQVDPDSGSALGGLGVGLALVRRVVELHGGSVRASSEGLGRGSEFVVRLPVVAHAARRERPAAHAEQNIEPLRILVVDDNEDAANSLALLLQSMGHEVRAVFSGADALSAVGPFDPDALLLDIGMPAMNGYEVARAVRATSGARHIIVAVTGWGHDAAKRQARDAGFDHHLVKPVSEQALLELLAGISTELRASPRH